MRMNLNPKALDQQLASAVYYNDLPGLAAGIGTSQGLLYQRALGVKRVDTMEPLMPEDIFHMASLAKLFTGAGILKLWEEQQLHPEDPVFRYLGDAEWKDPHARDMTIRGLLSHTAGLPDVTDYHWDRPEYSASSLGAYFKSDEIRNLGLLWPPRDQRFSYSNIGYDLLGHVIARVSGLSFEDAMYQWFFKTLSMSSSTFFTPDRKMDLLCAPHGKDRDNHPYVLPHYPYNRIHGPSSTLTSNLTDIGKWAGAHLKGNLFRKDTREIMWTPLAPVPGNKEQICLSWFRREQEGQVLFGHEGADTGFRSSLWLCPNLDLFIIVCANMDRAPVKKISKALFQLVAGLD